MQQTAFLAALGQLLPFTLLMTASAAEPLQRPPEASENERIDHSTEQLYSGFVPPFSWHFYMMRDVADCDSVVVDCHLSPGTERPFRLRIPRDAKPPRLVLHREGQAAIMRPLARGPGLYEVAYQAYPLGVPQSFFHAKFDLYAYFGKLTPGTYYFWIVWKAGDFIVDGPPDLKFSGDLVSPSVKITVRPTPLKEVTEQWKRDHEVMLVRGSKPASVALEAVPTGTLTNRRKQPLYVLAHLQRDTQGRATFTLPLRAKRWWNMWRRTGSTKRDGSWREETVRR